WCAAKKQAFVGYRFTIAIQEQRMPILEYHVTAANVHDSVTFQAVGRKMAAHGTLDLIDEFYGDNAHYTAENRAFLLSRGVQPRFHTRDESGKSPVNKRASRRKSRVRSKVEVVFGILTSNYAFGRVLVCGLDRVEISLSLICIGWNFFFLMSYFVGRFDDRISLRELLNGKL
ncbi:MAG: transposase, partial [Promethearchaeota archaeon]